MKFKTCTKCGKELPATNEYFVRDKSGKYGLRADCKNCNSIYRKKHYNKNKESIRKKQNEYLKQYHIENKDKISEYKKRYYKENKERILSYCKQYREKNREYIKSYKREYKANNRELFNKHKQKRRAIKKGLVSTLTTKRWEEIKRDFNHQCAYCGMTEKEHIKECEEQLHQEHFIPVSDKGEHTINNIIPACRSCNSSKGNKNFFEWYPDYKHYDKKRENFILEYLNYMDDDAQQLALY